MDYPSTLPKTLGSATVLRNRIMADHSGVIATMKATATNARVQCLWCRLPRAEGWNLVERLRSEGWVVDLKSPRDNDYSGFAYHVLKGKLWLSFPYDYPHQCTVGCYGESVRKKKLRRPKENPLQV